MAKESTIRTKCKEELIKDGWVCWIPTRNRFGAGVTHTKDGYKMGDDIFNIFDLVAWRYNKMLLIQYTTKGLTSTRLKKIKKWISKNKVSLPKGVSAEVWGYTDRVGFDKKIKI